jgi:hypothetical protein
MTLEKLDPVPDGLMPPRSRGPAARQLLRATSRTDQGELRYDVAPGTELLLAVVAPGQPLRHQRVVVAGVNSEPTVCAIASGEPAPVGALSLRLLDRETGIPSIDRRPQPPWPEGLPAGEYDLVAEALPHTTGTLACWCRASGARTGSCPRARGPRAPAAP